MSLTALGLAQLLARLHADPEEAGREYERLRRVLVNFFDWRGAWPPEECADETLDRLSRKLESTSVTDVRNYAHGIARLVLLEWRRRPAPDSLDDHAEPAIASAAPQADADDRRRCFDQCLAGLAEDGRSLVLEYYREERQSKIANRRRLAASLGVTEVALRSRVHRVREQLDRCVQACMSNAAGRR